MYTGNEIIPIPAIETDDDFESVLMEALHLYRAPFAGKNSNCYSCGGDCSCVWIPDWEGDVVYLDRFVQSRSDCFHGSAVECFCHNYPAIVEREFRSVIWGNKASDYEAPQRCKCGKLATAFVFAQFSDDGKGGSRWVCEDVCPPAEGEDAQKSIELILVATGIPEGH